MKRFCWVLCWVLAACGGPEVRVGVGEGPQQAIEAKSMAIVFSGKTSTGWTKHERSNGLQKPVASEQEKQASAVRCNELGKGIVAHLRPQTKDRLAPYLATTDKEFRNALTVEINRIMADTDGSADLQVTVSYGARGNEKPGWSRIVHIQASRFASGESVSRELADAALAQLKASALIQ